MVPGNLGLSSPVGDSWESTEGYCGNGRGGNEDNSKSNSGKNWERGGNNGGGVSHLSLIFFFLVGLTTRSQGLFFAQYITVT